MKCDHACPMLQKLLNVLRQLLIVYGYLVQNAPSEEARRQMELNLMTVRNSIERVTEIMHEMTEFMTPTGETLEEVPVFANFVDAARFAFVRETQVIAMANNLMMIMDECYDGSFQSLIVDHQLNAMRILYVLT